MKLQLNTMPALICMCGCLAGCVSSSGPQYTSAPIMQNYQGDVLNISNSRDSIIIRKSKKYGINPNLVDALLKAELRKAGFNGNPSDEGLEWTVEQISRVMGHVLKRTKSVGLAVEYYATGNFSLSQEVDDEARAFTREVIREFKRLESIKPWKGWS
ncbi:hypothetical protein BVX94_01625 [bacterium B17]|nr:hypothetical protein BVX94_01625 [bacterium B17]